jgi:hypothetical protein
MAEMIFRIPSRVVQYGYVELPLAMEPGMSPEMIAAAYVNYVHAFQKEEEATIERLKEAVRAPVAASQSEVDQVIDETLKRAQELMQEALGAAEIREEIDEREDNPAPWDTEAEAPKPKPWEQKETTVVVSDEW